MTFSITNATNKVRWVGRIIVSSCFFAVAWGSKLISYFRVGSADIHGELKWGSKANSLDQYEKKSNVQGNIKAFIANNTIGITPGTASDSYSYVSECCKMTSRENDSPGTSVNVIQLLASTGNPTIDEFKDEVNKICRQEVNRANSQEHEELINVLLICSAMIGAVLVLVGIRYFISKANGKINQCKHEADEAEDRALSLEEAREERDLPVAGTSR